MLTHLLTAAALPRVRSTLGLCLLLVACNKPADAPPAAAAEPEPVAPVAAAPAVHSDHPAAADPTTALPMPPIPAGAKVMFNAPHDGDKVEGPLENGKVTVKVQMGAEGIAIKPAGIIEGGSGHHHIVVDGLPIELGNVVPKDETHLHFGKGQTEADVPLTVGEHSLTLQLADGLHRSYGPALSATIKISVVAAGSVGAAAPAAAVPAAPAPTKPAAH